MWGDVMQFKKMLMENQGDTVKTCAYVALLLVAVLLCVQAYALYSERSVLATQVTSLRQQLAQVQQFALAHKDYDAYSEKQRREIATLERELAKRSSSAESLKLVQRLAAEQGVRIISVQTQGDSLPGAGEVKSNGVAKGGATLRITASGSFLDSLRWLRKLEREGIALESIIVKQEKLQEVQMEMMIKL